MKFKIIILLSSLILTSFALQAQSAIEIKDIDPSIFSKNLNGFEFLSESKTMDYSVKLFLTETKNNQSFLYVTISEFGPETLNNIFKAGPFYNPEFEEWKKVQLNPGFIIESGQKKRKRIIMSVNLNELVLHEINTLPE